MCVHTKIYLYARWPQQHRADFHEGRDFRKNVQINNITRLYKNTKTKKELLYRQRDESILSVCLILIKNIFEKNLKIPLLLPHSILPLSYI